MRQLAHELNGLLDGAMRSLRLAETRFHASEDSDAIAAGCVRLQRARLAMDEMALVLRRAMAGATCGPAVFGSDRTLGEEIERVMAALGPQAEEAGVHVEIALGAGTDGLPAGPLGPVLLNGIRNAIEACGGATITVRRVEVSVRLSPDRGHVTLLVSDTGAGLPAAISNGANGAVRTIGRSTKQNGHGLGTEVCRSLVEALGGRYSLTNVPFGHGAIMQAHVPVRSLCKP